MLITSDCLIKYMYVTCFPNLLQQHFHGLLQPFRVFGVLRLSLPELQQAFDHRRRRVSRHHQMVCDCWNYNETCITLIMHHVKVTMIYTHLTKLKGLLGIIKLISDCGESFLVKTFWAYNCLALIHTMLIIIIEQLSTNCRKVPIWRRVSI